MVITSGPSGAPPRRPRVGPWIPAVLILVAVALLWGTPTPGMRVNPVDSDEDPTPVGPSQRLPVSDEPLPSRDWDQLDRGPLGARWPAVIAWTGDELVVWGGVVLRGAENFGDGAAYNPATSTWRQLRPSPLGPQRQAGWVWTDTELVVWSPDGAAAAWDPARNRWREIGDWPLQGRPSNTAIWTGTEIIDVASATAIDPIGGSIRRIAASPYRSGRAVVWTGTEILVLPGGAYDPTTDRWRSLAPGPVTGTASAAAWTGSLAIVVDGAMNSAGYDPRTDAWSPLGEVPLPSLGCQPRAHFISHRIIAEICGDVGLLDTATGDWTPVAPPRARGAHTMIAAGDAFYAWGSGFYRLADRLLGGGAPARLVVGVSSVDLPPGWAVTRAQSAAPDLIEVEIEGPAGETCALTARHGDIGGPPAGKAGFLVWQISSSDVLELDCSSDVSAQLVAAGVWIPPP